MGNWREQEVWERPKRTYPDPATVRAALTGGDPLCTGVAEPDLPLDEGENLVPLLQEALASDPKRSGGAVWVAFPQHSPERPIPLQRCLTCGREDECCCPGCPTCPEAQMAPGVTSAVWAQRMAQWGSLDPRAGAV